MTDHIHQNLARQQKAVILIVIASLAAEGTPRLTLELCRKWLMDGVRPIVVVMQSTPDDLAPEFDALALERLTLNLTRHGYARYLLLAFQIFRIARRRRAHALLSMPLGWHAFMAIGARLAGVQRVIAHVGNYPDVSAGRAFFKFRLLVQLGRPFTDKLVCCSHYVREGAMRYFGVAEKETAVVYNGVPIIPVTSCVERPETAGQTNPTPFIIGMVARLEHHKDQPTLISAARLLKARGRNIRVWIIGEGSRRREFEQLIRNEGVDDIVDLLGMRRDVITLLNRMNLFAFSTTPDEGLGIALLEAMVAGRPIVASDVGACREVLDHGRLGYLVTPQDPIALADAIDTICSNSSDAYARAREARNKASRDFSIEDMARGYGKLLDLPIAKPDCGAVAGMELPR
jgi:glycosyltransferase involved in cell wall biosynthesis